MRLSHSKKVLGLLFTLTLTTLIFSHCATEDGIPPSQQLKAFCASLLNIGGDPNQQLIGGSDGLLLGSDNGGADYFRVELPFSYAIKDAGASPDGQYIYTVGENGSYATSADFGNNWTSQMLIPDGSLNSLAWSPLSPNIGYIAGSNGSIFKTDDHGATWNSQNSGVGLNLNGICFSDDDNGWAVGDGGTILKTTDGGINWQAKSSGTNLTLRACYRYDLTLGFAVGDGGTILSTLDQGETWSFEDSMTNLDLWDIKGKLPNGTTIAVGDGVILRQDGFFNPWVEAWNEFEAGVDLFFKKLAFGADQRVQAVGYTGLGQGFDFLGVPGLIPPDQEPSSDGLVAESDDDGANWFQVKLKVQF